jgi:hypothetical protein
MTATCTVHLADCLDWCRQQPDDSVDMVFGSPPYENRRTYGELGFNLTGQQWVDWAVERFREQYRICRGLTCWIVEGVTKDFQWSATPALLMADLHRAGVRLRKPPAYVRHGIPGSGGPDWWKNRYEFCVCATKGKLPWSDNTACGTKVSNLGGPRRTFTGQTRRQANGARQVPSEADLSRLAPEIPNPGNLIDCGAGTDFGLGNETDAPFPEALVEPFVLSFCPPGGLVYDPFSGSGTTAKVCLENGRNFVGTDLRPCQVELTRRRVEIYQPKLF